MRPSASGRRRPRESYLNIARDSSRLPAQAAPRRSIPGYGFLSENAAVRRGAAATRASSSSGRRRRRSAPWARRSLPRRACARRACRCCRAMHGDEQELTALEREARALGLPLIIKPAAPAAAARACRSCAIAPSFAGALAAARRLAEVPSAMARCCSSGTSRHRATSRSRCSPTRTAISCTSATATARCSGATRSSSRRPPRRPCPPRCASGCGPRRWSWRARSAT